MKKLITLIALLATGFYGKAQTWSALGTGLNSGVLASTVYGGNLVVGGYFTTAGGSTANGIAVWDGGTWTTLGTGLNGYVSALAVYGGNLYAAGYFTAAGGTSASNIAEWNGTTWSALGSGTDGQVYCLTVYGTGLVAGGWFTHAGGNSASGIASWNGTAWSSLGTGMSDTYFPRVFALTVYNGNLYAGGWFSGAGAASANCIAEWNGTAWSALSTGMDIDVTALTVYNGKLIAGGDFLTAGGATTGSVAQWDGSSWSAVNPVSGFYQNVKALTVYNNDLIVADGQAPNEYWVQMWNGTRMNDIDSGNVSLGSADTVDMLIVYNGSLYEGGTFSSAGGVSANNIAKFTQCTVPATPVWFESDTAICQYGQYTFKVGAVGGATSYTWTLPAGWSIFGSSSKDSIVASPGQSGVITVSANNGCGSNGGTSLLLDVHSYPSVIITPYDTTICAGDSVVLTAHGADNYTWPVGVTCSGAGCNTVIVKTTTNVRYVVYGSNNAAGCVDSNFVSITVDSACGPLGIGQVKSGQAKVTISPNPSNGLFNLHISGNQSENRNNIEVYNMLGDKVYADYVTSTNAQMNLSNNAKGVYLYRITSETGSLVSTGKLVIQ